MANFIRLTEVVKKADTKRVVSITVKPVLDDMTGMIWMTDFQLQEGSELTGYIPHTKTMLKKLTENDTVKAPVWFNGVIRSKETVILFNLGNTSAGLDLYISPVSDIAAGTVTISQGRGGQRVHFPQAMSAQDNIALLSTSRECTKNGLPFKKEGFYQYSAAWDSKHNIELEDKKSVRVLFELQEMEDGEESY